MQRVLKSYNLRDCVYGIAQAWDLITKNTLIIAWNLLLNYQQTEQTYDKFSNLKEVTESINRIPGLYEINEGDIIDWLDSEEMIESDLFIIMKMNLMKKFHLK